MSLSESKIYTWKCDIPDCNEKLTAGENHLYAIEKGWGQYTIQSFGMAGDRKNHLPETKLYLCPDHNDQLRGFLFDVAY